MIELILFCVECPRALAQKARVRQFFLRRSEKMIGVGEVGALGVVSKVGWLVMVSMGCLKKRLVSVQWLVFQMVG